MSLHNQIEEARVRSEAAQQEIVAGEEREQASLLSEQRMRQEMRVQAEEFQEESECIKQCAQERNVEYNQFLQKSERACKKLEARLARRTRWREEAERQIHEMVTCGEDLERECALLRNELVDQEHEIRNEHCEPMR